MTLTEKQEIELQTNGFIEINENDGSGMAYTATCSGSRSDCCTRVCSDGCNDKNDSVSSESEWEAFLEVKGGQVQY